MTTTPKYIYFVIKGDMKIPYYNQQKAIIAAGFLYSYEAWKKNDDNTVEFIKTYQPLPW